jgi:hypothetical protein
MYTVDIHYAGATKLSAKYNIDESIKIARREKDKLLCLIVGRGNGGTHKIKTETINILSEYKNENKIKDFICGSDLDLFSSIYLNFKFKERIPELEKKKKNPGAIYVIL